MGQTHLTIPRQELADFCRRWQVTELALFGSVLGRDFDAESDVDILVRFGPEAGRTLFDLVAMEGELEAMLGREVDLVERTAIERSENYIRRKAILSNTEPIYAA